MSTGYTGVAFPDPEPDRHVAASRPPRNYLTAGEHRKLFWSFMPPAIVAMVALELVFRPIWQPPPAPRERQIDTRMETIAGPPPTDGAVVILSDDELPEVTDGVILGASPEALSKVRDATFFGARDHDAWMETFRALQDSDGQAALSPRDVGFTEIFTQPVSFRGRPVRMRGTLRRLEKVPARANDHGIDHFWQGWLEPAGGPASPIVVHFLRLPAGMGDGMELAEPVVVTGFFLKNMAYRASDGVRVAPLVMALEPGRPLAPSTVPELGGFWDRSIVAVGVATMLAIVAMIGVGYWIVGRGHRRRLSAVGLDSSLTDVEPFSISDSLQTLSAATSKRTGMDNESGGANNE
jgi:hypothetical protein